MPSEPEEDGHQRQHGVGNDLRADAQPSARWRCGSGGQVGGGHSYTTVGGGTWFGRRDGQEVAGVALS